MAKVRHMFPGGNTAKGFFSFYDYILPQAEAKRIFILKGGPGVGKSSFMKKIAEAMYEKGYDVEYMHCSSDPNSLDGVVFPGIRIAMMDGTAPHVVDPKTPGAIDEMINLGEFWQAEKISGHKSVIMQISKEIAILFARAYRYIQAAYEFYQDYEAICSRAVDRGKVNGITAEITDDIFHGIEVSEVEGKQRHLFASAITPQGFVHFLPSLMTTAKIIALDGSPGTGTERLLERVRLCAEERGIYTESYHCALNPYKLEHLIIPELDVSLTTRNSIHALKQECTAVINFDEYLRESMLEKSREAIKFNREETEKLLKRAVETIKQAKEYHDELESFYIPNMDFDQIQKCREGVLFKILQSYSE